MLTHVQGDAGMLPQDAVCRQTSLELFGSPLLSEMTGRSHNVLWPGKESFPCSMICTCSPPCIGVRGAGMTVSLLRQQDPGTGGMPMHTGPTLGQLSCTVYRTMSVSLRIVVACSPGINVYQRIEGSVFAV